MMISKVNWLIVVQLLLSEPSQCRVAPFPNPTNRLLPSPGPDKQDHQTLQGSHPLSATEDPDTAEKMKSQSAMGIVTQLEARLQGQIQDHLHIQGNISCLELLSASMVDDPLSSVFPQELLGLSLVPVLVVAGCPTEAQTLVLKLYHLLGVTDTNKLLTDVQGLIEKKSSRSISAKPSMQGDDAQRHMEAVMFNIKQLAVLVGETREEGQCDGWTTVNGTKLIGEAVEGSRGKLEKAMTSCERLGVLCAGVTYSGPLTYQAVLKKGSRILPSDSPESECWIQQCGAEEQTSDAGASKPRLRRSAERSCINKREERVYNVVEWIPAVSTLYNLGTAVYYASVNCSQTAKERAILSAVDLGTDALMVATGGTAGVAGYALGAGVKTGVKAGVKYLLNSMKEEDDLLVNQHRWEQVDYY